MVVSTDSICAPTRKPARVAASALSTALDHAAAAGPCAAGEPAATCTAKSTCTAMRAASVHGRIPAGVCPDELVAVLSALEEEGGCRTLGDLACAIAASPSPVATIVALAKAGLVVLDEDDPFDAMLQVRRA
ncbi:hypothetical protein [Salinarimonas rosea]|uniref:hypothetical protein n=1 Tax=Salinarimonas rosea TaxID=552063 RepID=UPI000411411E|nr:hypothetical protein [Salinarimonas rosea]